MTDAEFTGLVVKIKGDLGDYTSKLSKMDADTQRTSQSVISALENIGAVSIFKGGLGVAAAITGIQGISGAFSDAIKSGIQFNSTMQQNEIAFGSMLKDVSAGKQLLGDLWNLAEQTPFEFPELQSGAKKLLAFGFAAKDIVPILTTIGDTASAMGMSSAEGIGRITKALGQMQAKSKVSGDEMLQLTEAGIPAWDILAKAMNKTTAEVMALSEKGLIPADQAIQALLAGMNERFGGMMEKQSQTFQGQMSTLADTVSSTMGVIVKPAFDALANETLPAVIDKVGTLRDVMKAGGYDGLAKSILPVDAVNGLEVSLQALSSTTTTTFDTLNNGIALVSDNFTGLAVTAGIAFSVLEAEAIISGVTVGLEAIAGGAWLAATGFTGLTMAAMAFLLTPVGAALTAITALFGVGAYAAWQYGNTVTQATDDAESGTKRFLDGSIVMADGSTAAFSQSASAAEDAANRIESAGNRSYAAAMTLWQALSLAREVKKEEDQGGGFAGWAAAKDARESRKNAAYGSGAQFTAPSLPEKKSRGGGGHQQTEFEKYRSETQDLLSIWNMQADLEKISQDQLVKNIQERLSGLEAINATEKEALDKQKLELELTSKIQTAEKQQRQEAIQAANQKYQIGEITLDQYAEIVKKQSLLATSDKERLDRAVQLYQVQEKLTNKLIQQQEYLSDRRKAALSLMEEAERHNLEMIEIFSDQGTETKIKNWESETTLSKKYLDNQYQEAVKTLENEIVLSADNIDKHKELLEKKEALDEKYQLDRLKSDNEITEKIASEQKRIIDANNDMITSLISGTKSGHDILQDMWSEFVHKVVEKNLSISSSLNIFEQILGPLFGLGSSKSLAPKSSTGWTDINVGVRAAGGPVSSNSPYIVGEVGPELFIPNSPGTIIPNSQLKNVGAAPKISLTVVNNTGTEADVKTSQPQFDGEQYICEVVLDKAVRSPVYARNMRSALGVG